MCPPRAGDGTCALGHRNDQAAKFTRRIIELPGRPAYRTRRRAAMYRWLLDVGPWLNDGDAQIDVAAPDRADGEGEESVVGGVLVRRVDLDQAARWWACSRRSTPRRRRRTTARARSRRLRCSPSGGVEGQPPGRVAELVPVGVGGGDAWPAPCAAGVIAGVGELERVIPGASRARRGAVVYPDREVARGADRQEAGLTVGVVGAADADVDAQMADPVPSASAAAAAAAMRRNGFLNVSLLLGRAGSPRGNPPVDIPLRSKDAAITEMVVTT